MNRLLLGIFTLISINVIPADGVTVNINFKGVVGYGNENLCYDSKQNNPIFDISLWDSVGSKTISIVIISYSKPRSVYHYGLEDGDTLETYSKVMPIFQDEKTMRVRLEKENYRPEEGQFAPKKPQWLEKMLEFKRLPVPLKWAEDFDANDPKKRYPYFTVTVDGKTMYQCGATPMDNE